MNDNERLVPCVSGSIGTELEVCTPTCVRWSQINEGEPVRIYHDGSDWDNNHFQQFDVPDPIVLLNQAMDLWNDAYACGDLFRLVSNEADANIVVRYFPNDPEFNCLLGSMICACEPEDDPCVRNLDHTQIFANSTALFSMYKADCAVNFPRERIVNTYLHELGHGLGMGHVLGLADQSVMGNNPDAFTQNVLYPFDVAQVDLRHPCGCLLQGSVTEPLAGHVPLFNSGATCPGCIG